MSLTRHALAALSLATLGGLAAPAFAQSTPQYAEGRVVSATPVVENGRTSYSVRYEYNGRTYTTRTDSPPGPTIGLQVSDLGVSTYPVAPQPSMQTGQVPPPAGNTYATQAPWAGAPVEPGVVVSSAPAAVAAPAPQVYATPAYPAYTAYPAPVYYPAPVMAAPVYSYPAPYVYPAAGLSLNFGYSRGWHRRW